MNSKKPRAIVIFNKKVDTNNKLRWNIMLV